MTWYTSCMNDLHNDIEVSTEATFKTSLMLYRQEQQKVEDERQSQTKLIVVTTAISAFLVLMSRDDMVPVEATIAVQIMLVLFSVCNYKLSSTELKKSQRSLKLLATHLKAHLEEEVINLRSVLDESGVNVNDIEFDAHRDLHIKEKRPVLQTCYELCQQAALSMAQLFM